MKRARGVRGLFAARRLPKLGFALAVVVAFGYVSLRPESGPTGPVLVVTRGKSGPPPERADSFVLDTVIAHLDVHERDELARLLAETITRLEARANPLLEDLEDSDPEAPLEAWSASRVDLVRTAAEVARARRCAADDLCVTTALTCPKDAHCVPTWGRSTDPIARRARFLAWPMAGAVWLRAPDRAAHATMVAGLRKRAREPSSSIALVATRRDVEMEEEELPKTLRERWARWRALSRIVKKERLEPSTAEVSSAQTLPLPWTDLDVLVVPRLGSLGSPAAFVLEVREQAVSARVLGAP